MYGPVYSILLSIKASAMLVLQQAAEHYGEWTNFWSAWPTFLLQLITPRSAQRKMKWQNPTRCARLIYHADPQSATLPCALLVFPSLLCACKSLSLSLPHLSLSHVCIHGSISTYNFIYHFLQHSQTVAYCLRYPRDPYLPIAKSFFTIPSLSCMHA